jgi:hypothetical protein
MRGILLLENTVLAHYLILENFCGARIILCSSLQVLTEVKITKIKMGGGDQEVTYAVPPPP